MLKRSRSTIAFVTVLAVAATQTAAGVAQATPSLGAMQFRAFVAVRPPPLAPVVGCSRWEGMISGNDPSAMVRLRLCQSGTRVFGRLQWSSMRTGWNERNLDGFADATGAIVMRDTYFVSSMPAPGVRFCLIDHYALRYTGPMQLLGSYESYACRDRAVVNLRRVL